MEKEAILHIPLSQFAFAEKEDRLVIRIRCKKGDLKRCVLLWGDPVSYTHLTLPTTPYV